MFPPLGVQSFICHSKTNRNLHVLGELIISVDQKHLPLELKKYRVRSVQGSQEEVNLISENS